MRGDIRVLISCHIYKDLNCQGDAIVILLVPDDPRSNATQAKAPVGVVSGLKKHRCHECWLHR